MSHHSHRTGRANCLQAALTRAQFSLIDSDNKGDTVQCNHCKTWTSNVKTLARKKDHLFKCPQYAAWRAAGNGQDLAPAAPYNKRDSSRLDDEYVYHTLMMLCLRATVSSCALFEPALTSRRTPPDTVEAPLHQLTPLP